MGKRNKGASGLSVSGATPGDDNANPDVPPVDADQVDGDQSDADEGTDDPEPADGDGASDPQPLRTDGPTLAEWVAAGYLAEKYPPDGYAVREAEAPAAPHVPDVVDAAAPATADSPTMQTMSEVAHQLAMKALADNDQAAYAALHSVELALSTARHSIGHAQGSLSGEALQFVSALATVL